MVTICTTYLNNNRNLFDTFRIINGDIRALGSVQNGMHTVTVCYSLDVNRASRRHTRQLVITQCMCRSRCLHFLRHRSAAAPLLGSRVRIPAGTWMSLLSVVCRQVEVSATGQSLVQRNPTECVSVSLSVLSTCVSAYFHLRVTFIVIFQFYSHQI